MRSLASGLIIQIASSASNFLLVLGVSRASSAEEFGGFALIYALLGFCLGVIRSSVLDVLLIDAGREPIRTDELHSVAGRILQIGLAIGLIGVFAALSVSGSAGNYLVLLAGGVVVVLLNDLGRFAAIAVKEPAGAVASDVAWLVLAAIAFFAPISPELKVVVWLAGALLGAVLNRSLRAIVIGAFAERRPPQRSPRPRFAYVADFVLLAARGLVFLFALQIGFGATAVAVIAVSQQLFQPLSSLLQGIRFSYLGTMAGRGAPSARSLSRWLAGALVLGVAWTYAIDLVSLDLATSLVGDSFNAMKPFLWAVCLFEVCRLIEVVLLDWFKASNRSVSLLRLRSLSTALLFAISLAIVSGVVTSLQQVLDLRLAAGFGVVVVSIAAMVAFATTSRSTATALSKADGIPT